MLSQEELLASQPISCGSPRRAHFVDGDGHTHRVNPFMLSPVRRRAADRHAVSPPQRFGLSGGGLRFPSDDPYW